jgi:signal transduction histidine kinase
LAGNPSHLRQFGLISNRLPPREAAIVPGMTLAQSSGDDAKCSHENEIPQAAGHPMKRVLPGLARLPKPLTFLLAFLSAAAIGWLDYTMGPGLEVTAFYLVPICWACWAAGRKAGALLAVASVIVGSLADAASGKTYAQPTIAYWNAAMLLAVFLVAVYSITAFMGAYQALAEAQTLLRNSNERLEITVQQRTAALRAEIAERERVEKEKLQAERLLERQEKLAVLGTLTAGIAHEIRNPLTSVKARLYTLDKHLETPALARKDTEIISAEISRLERIVQDVLSFARPSEPNLETITASVVLQEVQGLMSSNLENRGVKLVVESGPALHLCADSGHLKQVLINLVRNAAESIDGTGVVTLRPRQARVQLGGRETEVAILEVSDTGKGIPPGVEKRLFDPFFSTKETGTGLGLSISARLVEKQGGVLQYQTHVGRGTTFGIVLPLSDSTALGKKADEPIKA